MGVSRHAQNYLKSNMDRFIVIVSNGLVDTILHLKSNMDRFIALIILSVSKLIINLKSNMDRFIDYQ